jgi:hypothetical protein
MLYRPILTESIQKNLQFDDKAYVTYRLYPSSQEYVDQKKKGTKYSRVYILII